MPLISGTERLRDSTGKFRPCPDLRVLNIQWRYCISITVLEYIQSFRTNRPTARDVNKYFAGTRVQDICNPYYRKPRWGLAHASDFWLENLVELYDCRQNTNCQGSFKKYLVQSSFIWKYISAEHTMWARCGAVPSFTLVGVGKDPVRLEILSFCPPAWISLPSVTLPDSNRWHFQFSTVFLEEMKSILHKN